MRRFLASAVCLASPVAFAASPKAPAWKGEAGHFMVEGNIAGEDLKYDLKASNNARFWCEREWIVPLGPDGQPDPSKGRLHEIKIQAFLERSDQHYRVELELKRHDFQRDKTGTTVSMVPRSRTQEPSKQEMWLEWEWHAVDAAQKGTWENFESDAKSGTFKLMLFSGKPGPDGLVIPQEEGRVGGTFEAQFSPTEKLVGSFSVDCRVNRVSPHYL